MGHQVENAFASLQRFVQMLHSFGCEWKELIDSLFRVACDPKTLESRGDHVDHGLSGDSAFFFRGFGVAERNVQVNVRDFSPLLGSVIKRIPKESTQEAYPIQGKYLNGK